MKKLTDAEICCVSGGGDLRQPIDNPKSEIGNLINEVAQALNDLGGWLGRKAYDLTHPTPQRTQEVVVDPCKK